MPVRHLSHDPMSFLFLERRQFYLDPNRMRELYPSEAPYLTSILAKRGTEVDDPDFKMFEYRAGWHKQELRAGSLTWGVDGAPNDTAEVTVTGVTNLGGSVDKHLIGLMVELRKGTSETSGPGAYGEKIGVAHIQAVAAGNKITLKSLGNPAAADNKAKGVTSGGDGLVMIVIGSAFGEGQYAPDAYHDELGIVWNSCGIHRTTLELTGTMYKQAKLRGYNSEIGRLRREKRREHKVQLDRMLLRSVRVGGIGASGDAFGGVGAGGAHVVDADGKIVRTTMGILPALERYGATSGDHQNLFTIDAETYNNMQWVQDSEKIFQWWRRDGILRAYCGMGAFSYFNSVDGARGYVGKSGFTVNLSDMRRHDTLGFRFKYLESPHGIIELVYEPQLDGPYYNSMLVVDHDDLRFMYYRAHSFRHNIKTDNGYDGVKDEFFSDCGVGITLLEKHSLWTVTNWPLAPVVEEENGGDG